jgi:hypothetical protein
LIHIWDAEIRDPVRNGIIAQIEPVRLKNYFRIAISCQLRKLSFEQEKGARYDQHLEGRMLTDEVIKNSRFFPVKPVVKGAMCFRHSPMLFP